MNVTFEFRHSREYSSKVLIETGERIDDERKMTCDAKTLSPEHRKRFLTDSIGYPRNDGAIQKLMAWDSHYDLWRHDGPIDNPNVVLDAYCLYCDEKQREKEEQTRAAQAEREGREKKAREAEAAREAKKHARINELKAWASDSGSELLRLRLEGGFEWEKLAGKEYARSIVDRLDLGLTEVTSSEWPRTERARRENRTTPTLEEIRSLNRVKEVARNLGLDNVTTTLEWITYESEPEYRDEDDEISQCEIQIEIKDPVGKEHSFFFLP